jgi:hypothetical protein
MPAYFYSHTIRNLVVALSSLFNNITVRRYDDAGNVAKEISPVPLKFGPLSKYYMRRMEDGSLKRYYIQLPTMALTINGFSYSNERAVSTKERRDLVDPEHYNDPQDFLSDLMPAPWDINFTLHIRTESFQDFCQIVEQIMPFFNPSVYLRVKEFNTINLERNIRVTLNGMNPEFSEDSEEDTVRTINGSLDFTADAWFYRPLQNSKVIRNIKTKYGFDPTYNMFEYYRTSAVELSALDSVYESALAYDTSGTITSGIFTTGTSAKNNYEYGYINLQVDE